MPTSSQNECLQFTSASILGAHCLRIILQLASWQFNLKNTTWRNFLFWMMKKWIFHCHIVVTCKYCFWNNRIDNISEVNWQKLQFRERTDRLDLQFSRSFWIIKFERTTNRFVVPYWSSLKFGQISKAVEMGLFSTLH